MSYYLDKTHTLKVVSTHNLISSLIILNAWILSLSDPSTSEGSSKGFWI